MDDFSNNVRSLGQIIIVIMALGYTVNLYWTRLKMKKRKKFYSKLTEFQEDRFCLYLRSFSNEKVKVQVGFFSMFLRARNMEKADDYLFRSAGDLLPIIKITDPHTKGDLPSLNLLKLDHNWKVDVIALMKKAELIIINYGVSEGLVWELDQIFSNDLLHKTRFLSIYSSYEVDEKKLYTLLESAYGVSIKHSKQVPLFKIENMKTVGCQDLKKELLHTIK